jgi:hypothetical protein
MFISEPNIPPAEQFLATIHPEANRNLIIKALRYLVDRGAASDIEVTEILRAYTLESTVFNYEALPDLVASQLTFRSPAAGRCWLVIRVHNRRPACGHPVNRASITQNQYINCCRWRSSLVSDLDQALSCQTSRNCRSSRPRREHKRVRMP